MEKPQYIDWIVEEAGIVIKNNIPLKCYKMITKTMMLASSEISHKKSL